MVDLTGQFGLSTISGRAGWWVGLGQFLIGDASRFSHAFVCVGNGEVVEAMPGGADLTPLSYYTEGPKAAVTVFSDLDLTDDQRITIAATARALINTPYNFLDYLVIALDHWGIRPKRLRKYMADRGHLICSQLVDLCFLRAGVHLFEGVDPGDVSPGDLADYLIRYRRETP